MIDSVWYPYTQHATMPKPLSVVSAKGSLLFLEDGTSLIDAISSWWCVIHGYNHPVLNQAVMTQLSQFSHVMLGGLTHTPVQALAQKLVALSPEGLSHVFFSDSGSVGVEVALKMALGYWQQQGKYEKTRFLTLKYAYHGDTFGAMSVCDPLESMHYKFSSMLSENFVLASPSDDLTLALQDLEKTLVDYHSHCVGLILEPLVQGAGGMKFYSPDYLIQARRLCSEYGVLMIVDEVATGFGRTGKWFAVDFAEVTPDIMIVGKGLTAGYMGMAATLATDRVFDAFYSKNKTDALMHGPTFMGNALACAVALANIKLLEDEDLFLRINQISAHLASHLVIDHPQVKVIRFLGAIAVVEVKDRSFLYRFQEFAISHGVWIRPIENVIYCMPAYTISIEELDQIIRVIKLWFQKK